MKTSQLDLNIFNQMQGVPLVSLPKKKHIYLSHYVRLWIPTLCLTDLNDDTKIIH